MSKTNPNAFVRGIFVGSGSQGDAARQLSAVLKISVSRARACVDLARSGASNDAIEAIIADAKSPDNTNAAAWHTAPDGTPCCCTAEDRQYGCGCR